MDKIKHGRIIFMFWKNYENPARVCFGRPVNGSQYVAIQQF